MDSPESKMRSQDRILVLRKVNPKLGTGNVDTRIFTGDNKIRAVLDPPTTMWSFKYEQGGVLPEPLKGKFTSFKGLLNHAGSYFAKRNIEIVEVQD